MEVVRPYARAEGRARWAERAAVGAHTLGLSIPMGSGLSRAQPTLQRRQHVQTQVVSKLGLNL